MSVLAPILFPFFRHVISSVRLAVVDTFANFLAVPALIGDWISQPFLRLLYQNLIVEERSDVRDTTFSVWKRAIDCLKQMSQLENTVRDVVLPWFTVLMNPIGSALDVTLFYQPPGSANQLHNVDKPMLIQDLSLVSEEAVIRGRVMGCKAIGYCIAEWPTEVSVRSRVQFLVG